MDLSTQARGVHAMNTVKTNDVVKERELSEVELDGVAGGFRFLGVEIVIRIGRREKESDDSTTEKVSL